MLGPPKPGRLDEPVTASLEALVPRGNFYRRLEAKLDLGFVREWAKGHYADRGRPSIDPVIFVKPQLVMVFEGIRSERKLVETASLNLAHPWYFGSAPDGEPSVGQGLLVADIAVTSVNIDWPLRRRPPIGLRRQDRRPRGELPPCGSRRPEEHVAASNTMRRGRRCGGRRRPHPACETPSPGYSTAERRRDGRGERRGRPHARNIGCLVCRIAPAADIPKWPGSSLFRCQPNHRIMQRWKRRGSIAPPRHGHAGTEPICVANPAHRRVSGRSRRALYHAPRWRKLSTEQEAAIRANAGNRSLRELAAEHAVSHETVRAVLLREALPVSGSTGRMARRTAVGDNPERSSPRPSPYRAAAGRHAARLILGAPA